jgi:hypothetical protein
MCHYLSLTLVPQVITPAAYETLRTRGVSPSEHITAVDSLGRFMITHHPASQNRNACDASNGSQGRTISALER